MSYGYDKQHNYYVRYPETQPKVDPVTPDKKPSKADKIRDAFAYDGEKTKAASRDLQYEYVIDKPLFYTFNIPKTGTAGTKKTGTGDYGTGRKDSYVAEYDAKGRLTKITAKNSQFGTTTVTYTYNDKGEMTETSVNDKSGSKSVTEYNKDGTTKTHAEWLTDEDGKFPKKPVLKREYSYDLDSKGNPVEKIQYTAGSNVTVQTTLNPDGTYTQKNFYTGTSTIIGKSTAANPVTTKKPTSSTQPAKPSEQKNPAPSTLNPSNSDKEVTYKDVFGYNSAIAKKESVASDKSDVVNLPLFYSTGFKQTSKANSTSVKTFANDNGGKDEYIAKYDKNGKLVNISKRTIVGQKNIIGPETKYTYSPDGTMVETTDSSNGREIVAYNPNGSLKTITAYTKDSKGNFAVSEKKEYTYSKGKDGSLTQIMNSSSGVHATASYTADGKYVFASSTSQTKPQNKDENKIREQVIKELGLKDEQLKWPSAKYVINEMVEWRMNPYTGNAAYRIVDANTIAVSAPTTADPDTETYYTVDDKGNLKPVKDGEQRKIDSYIKELESLQAAEEKDLAALYSKLKKVNGPIVKEIKKQVTEKNLGDYIQKSTSGKTPYVYVSPDGKTRYSIGSDFDPKDKSTWAEVLKNIKYTDSLKGKDSTYFVSKVEISEAEQREQIQKEIQSVINKYNKQAQKLVDQINKLQDGVKLSSEDVKLFKNSAGIYVRNDNKLGSRSYYDKNGNEYTYIFSIKTQTDKSGKQTWTGTFNGTTSTGAPVYGKLQINDVATGEGTLDGKPVVFNQTTGKIKFKNAEDEKKAKPQISATVSGKVTESKGNDGKVYYVIQKKEVSTFDEKDTQGYTFYDANGKELAHLVAPNSSGKGLYFGYDANSKRVSGEIQSATLNGEKLYVMDGKYCRIDSKTGKITKLDYGPKTPAKPSTTDSATLNPSNSDKQVTYKDVFGYNSNIAKKASVSLDKSDVVNLPLFYSTGFKQTSKANSTSVKTFANDNGGKDEYIAKYDKNGKLESISKKTINGKKNIVGPTTKYTYSPDGTMVETTDSSNGREIVAYNPNGSLQAISTFTKNTKGNFVLASKKEYTYSKEDVDGKTAFIQQVKDSVSGKVVSATIYTPDGKYQTLSQADIEKIGGAISTFLKKAKNILSSFSSAFSKVNNSTSTPSENWNSTKFVKRMQEENKNKKTGLSYEIVDANTVRQMPYNKYFNVDDKGNLSPIKTD